MRYPTIIDDVYADVEWRHTTRGTLSIYKYHGQSRHITLPELLNHDVILTTYGTVAADFRRKHSQIFRVLWYRIVLDEGDSPRFQGALPS